MNANELLKKYFGYDAYKTGQKQIIEQITSGNDVLAVMPTGAGKSVCFQIPALMFDGVTVVISPLISLMKDQVDALSEVGIKAAFINSSLSVADLNNVLHNAHLGVYKILYVAPERLETDGFLSLASSLPISFVAVDEAHCVSQWGHDFRPSYTRISAMIALLPTRPVVAAFTATATENVKLDIIRNLHLNKPYLLTTGFDRENLYFDVTKPNDKYKYVVDYLQKNSDKSGIIYCATRKNVDRVCEKLIIDGFAATAYHAGLSDKERVRNQDDFINDVSPIIIATNAFGMGIDKSNVRFVLHYNMPKTMENYYQEAGRAGRDGVAADCILLYSAQDIITNKLLIERGGENADKTGDYIKLKDIINYSNTWGCLRNYILNYFGETDQKDNCENCGNCNNNFEITNVTVEAQKILSCIKRMDERFGTAMVCDVLKGAMTEKITNFRFHQLSTYGIMKEYTKDSIKELILYLITKEYILLHGDEFPILKLSPSAYNVLKGNEKIEIKRLLQKEEGKKKGKTKSTLPTDNSLFQILRTLRATLAKAQNVPPYIIFSDAALHDMCRKLPVDDAEMLDVSGVGAVKLAKYGKAFLEEIKKYSSGKD